MSNSFPTWLDLLELWLKEKHGGKPAVVFVEPLGAEEGDVELRCDAMMRIFGKRNITKVAASQYSILECKTVEEALKIMRSVPENQPYAYAWDGKKIVSHH